MPHSFNTGVNKTKLSSGHVKSLKKVNYTMQSGNNEQPQPSTSAVYDETDLSGLFEVDEDDSWIQ